MTRRIDQLAPLRAVKPCARLAVTISLLFGLSVTVLAQTGAIPDRGIRPVGSYSVSDIENISLTNGNANLTIPLAALPPMAGGKLSWGLRAIYNSKLWNVTGIEFPENPPAPGYTANYIQLSDVGGWVVGGMYRIDIQTPDQDYAGVIPPYPDPEFTLLNEYRWKMILTTPDGAKHELRPTDTIYQSYPGNRDWARGYYRDTPRDDSIGLTMRYYSLDGSYLWAKIQNFPIDGAPIKWDLYMPDGTRIKHRNGVQQIFDTHLNSIKIWTDNVTHYVDEVTGREITFGFNTSTNSYQVRYQTVGDEWVGIDVNFGTTRVKGMVYEIGDDCERQGLVDTEIFVVRSIVLPQTEPGLPRKQFTLSYNSDPPYDTVSLSRRLDCQPNYQQIYSASHGWGSLSQMVTPLLATVNYSYDLDGVHLPLFDPARAPREPITAKTVTHDGVTDPWTYSIGSISGSVTGPDGSVTTETFYTHDPALIGTFGGPTGQSGLVYRTNRSNKIVVERRWSLKQFTGGNSASPGGQSGFNQVVEAEYTTLMDSVGNPAKMSARTMQYDYNGNVTSTTDYDWIDLTEVTVPRDSLGVPTSFPGTTVLRVVTNSYYNPATMAGDANYAKRDLTTLAPFIVNAPLETSVSDASTQVSRLQFLYDHATSTSTPPTIGNLTEEKRRLIQETRWIRTTHDYDSYGNRTLTINPSSNPNGNKIEFAYDATTHAQPISVTVYPDPLDPNNKLITTTEYDSATGLVKNQTDPNGKITETDYVNQRFKDAGITKMDPYGRPGVVTGPAVTSIFDGQPHTDQQRTVITKYFDNDRQVEVISDLKLNGDGLLRNRTTSDRIGRVTKTETSENGTSYAISSETSYKYKPSGQPGMAVFSTNPHRSASADTDGWTRTTQDVLGRTIEVATFGGSPTPPDTQCTSGANCTGTVVTSYDRFYTTVTDQASKQRRSVVDALGRLIRLDEPTTSGLGSVDNPNQKTEYSYDSPGNLIHVVQGLQHRYFKYDSLNRLIRARNVEQGANTPALDLTDPATGNNQWSTGYAYDDASNLLTRTNPNGTTVGFTYDGLNRVKTKTLSVGGAWTYAYDTGTNGKGRLASVTQTGGDGYYYDGYDAVGRVTASHQTTTTTQGGTQSYTLSYGYCLAGNMTKQVYPSGKEYRTDYDNAGRVSQVSRYVSSVFDKTYAAGFSYAAHGAVSAMSVSYGSGTPAMSELTRYNSRLQPTLMETRKVSTNELLLGLDFTYGTTTNNGNMQTQTIRIGGTTTPTWAINQSFTYDELSRLQTATETAGWSQEYGYDRFGNRWVSQSLGYVPDADLCPTQSSHISAATNRIVMNGFSYDTSGNQKTQTRDGQSENYDYDSENRLLSINSGAIGTYVYDGEGRRVKKTDGTGTTVFVYNAGGQLIAEYHSDPVPMPTGGGGTSYLTTDHLGSTRLVTNASGGTKERYDYLPFGEEVPSTLGVRGSVGGYGVIDGTRQKFTQKERDSESGLDYFLARYYSSAQGRFTSPDEFTGGPDDLFDFAEDAADNPTFYSDLHEPQSLNKYQYCYNNPLRYVDPNGHGITDRLKAAARNLKDTAIGVAKEAFNAIAAAGEALEAASQPLGAQRYALNIATGSNMELKPSNATQSVAMKSTFVAALLIGGGSRGASKGASQLSKAVELVSAIGKDKTLVKLAEEAGASAQKGIDALTSQLAKGNLNPGIGTKNLFGNISYARKRDGARVFFRQVEGKIEILAKATKKNEQAVIEKLKKLYQ